MATITSKYQVTIPKKIADKYNLKPGDKLDWLEAGETIRVVPSGQQAFEDDRETRLRLFDQATERIRRSAPRRKLKEPRGRRWKREDLYVRGRPR